MQSQGPLAILWVGPNSLPADKKDVKKGKKAAGARNFLLAVD